MALDFKQYQAGESVLDSIGTVLEAVGRDGSLSLIPKNFKDTEKRVVVILKKKNGDSAAVSCSSQVSEGLRNGTIKLEHLINFEMMEGESGIPFICLPGGALVEVKVNTLKAQDYVPSAVTYDELVGL